MKQRIDTRGVHPIYFNGLNAIELRDMPRNISIDVAVDLIERLRNREIIERSSDAIEHEKRHLIDCINWWGAYRKRNSNVDPENDVLDKVGTINGVIRELSDRLAAL